MTEARGREQTIFSVLAELASGSTTVSLYGPEHPRAGQSVEQLAVLLADIFAENREFSLVVLGEELFAQGQPVTRACRQALGLMRLFRRRKIEVIGIRAGVSSEELRRFLVDLAVTDDVPLGRYAHISLGQAQLGERELGGPDEATRGRGKGIMVNVRDRVEVIHECFAPLHQGGSFLAVAPLEMVSRAIAAAIRLELNPLRQLAFWRGEVHWPAIHAHNTCVLAAALASGSGAGALPVEELGAAALVHHVGKLKLPAEIREKELELAGEELELLFDHPQLSLQVLLGVPQVSPLALVTAFEHHLYYNGAGHPRLPRPRRPHPASRLVALASAATIFLTLRTERGTTTRDTTIAWFRSRAGTVFDPEMTGALIELLTAREEDQSPG